MVLNKHIDNIVIEMMTFENKDLFSVLMAFILPYELGQNFLFCLFKKESWGSENK